MEGKGIQNYHFEKQKWRKKVNDINGMWRTANSRPALRKDDKGSFRFFLSKLNFQFMRLCWTNVILTVREAKLMEDSVICEYYFRLHLTSDL